MKRFKLIALISILFTNIAYGHRDFWEIKDFGNVKVRFSTGFQYEEIKKAWIIGELAFRLCESLNYHDTVFIDFKHFYPRNCEPDYFISYDRGLISDMFNPDEPKQFLNGRSIVIREVAKQFSPATTLQLLEYAIINVEKIKITQRTINYTQNYCRWRINTIDTLLIKRITTDSLSDVLRAVLSMKILRPDDENSENDISYYFQNNKYHIFYIDYRAGRLEDDSVDLFTVNNVYQYENISFDESITFDSDTSFYFSKGVNNPHSSKRYVIESTHNNYRPFDINRIGSNKVILSFQYYDTQNDMQLMDRSILYKSDKDELLQDLDKVLNYSNKKLLKQRSVLIALVLILGVAFLFNIIVIFRRKHSSNNNKF